MCVSRLFLNWPCYGLDSRRSESIPLVSLMFLAEAFFQCLVKRNEPCYVSVRK